MKISSSKIAFIVLLYCQASDLVQSQQVNYGFASNGLQDGYKPQLSAFDRILSRSKLVDKNQITNLDNALQNGLSSRRAFDPQSEPNPFDEEPVEKPVDGQNQDENDEEEEEVGPLKFRQRIPQWLHRNSGRGPNPNDDLWLPQRLVLGLKEFHERERKPGLVHGIGEKIREIPTWFRDGDAVQQGPPMRGPSFPRRQLSTSNPFSAS